MCHALGDRRARVQALMYTTVDSPRAPARPSWAPPGCCGAPERHTTCLTLPSSILICESRVESLPSDAKKAAAPTLTLLHSDLHPKHYAPPTPLYPAGRDLPLIPPECDPEASGSSSVSTCAYAPCLHCNPISQSRSLRYGEKMPIEVSWPGASVSKAMLRWGPSQGEPLLLHFVPAPAHKPSGQPPDSGLRTWLQVHTILSLSLSYHSRGRGP